MDDDDPISPAGPPRGYGGVGILYRKDWDLRVVECPSGGNRICAVEILSDPPVLIIVASVLYCSIYHCTCFEENEIEKIGILNFDDLFIRDFRIISEGEICPYSVNDLDFINFWQ